MYANMTNFTKCNMFAKATRTYHYRHNCLQTAYINLKKALPKLNALLYSNSHYYNQPINLLFSLYRCIHNMHVIRAYPTYIICTSTE